MPRMINLHNYSGCNATNLKLYNWRTLDERVFRKLGRALPASECGDCARAIPGAIERVLRLLQQLLLERGLLPEGLPRPIWRLLNRREALMDPGHPAVECDELARRPKSPTLAGDVPASRHGVESNSHKEHMDGLQNMTGMSVELVEGALGESADFLIATYGMDAAHQDSLKPTAFNTSRQAKLEESVSTLGLQDKVQLEERVGKLEAENERLRRILSLHKQRCCILEEACLANGVHVPGGLLAHQHV
ncbi:g7387 [Coccomyxa viridis]|uniref:G7387 protein n=1 Tax=Coccomyxa viridis TaxID=1274662 RepID=A0ABP1FXQ8_9CHLO